LTPVSFKRFPALRERNFRLFLAAKFFAHIAIQMQGVAVGWQIYALTGEPLDLGLVGLAQFLPFAALVLPAGQAADRYDRRRILALCFLVDFLASLALLGFALTGLHNAWPVFGVMAVFGASRAFIMPTGQAIVVNLVPAESFSNAVALSSSAFHVAVICGPTLGGLLYLAGPHAVYGTVAALLALSMILVVLIRTRSRRAASRDSPSLSALLEGLRFVRSRPVVLGAISLDLFAVLFGGATALLPAYANEVLHVGPTGLGLLRTAPAVGAALTALLLAFAPISRRVGRSMFGGVALFGVSTVVFGLSESLPLSVAALFLLGAGDMVSVYIRHILVQFETPDKIRGRVSAVNSVFIGASNELGEFESGITAAWLGLVPAVIVGGMATLAVTFLWMALFPVLRTMDHFPHLAPVSTVKRSPLPPRVPYGQRKHRRSGMRRRGRR
jgi:MFS family permease